MKSNNTKAIELLDEWFDEPDEMGAEFWEEYGHGLTSLEIRGMADYQQVRDRLSWANLRP